MTQAEQAIYRENIERIAGYIASGCKQSQCLGVEFENILVHKADGSPVAYDGPHGVEQILERLSATYPEKTCQDGHVLGLQGGNATITLEPAACLEYSAGPFTTIDQVKNSLEQFRATLDPILDEFGLEVADLGYHPSACTQELSLIPKKRYEAMSRYLGEIGPYGACMMRGSASLQVSLDYTSEEDAIKKLRLVDTLAPLLSLLCDNSPIFEKKRAHQHMVRTLIWKNYDPARCMVIPHTFDDSFGFRDYAEFAYNQAAIIAPHSDGSWSYAGSTTFAQLYRDRLMEDADIEHALSMIFPDGRLKRFLEIRPADALPKPYALAYVALLKGVFYNEDNLDELSAAFARAHVNEERIAKAKESLMSKGYDGCAYDRRPAEWLEMVFEAAQRGLSEEEAVYLAPLHDLVCQEQTLAQRYPEDFYTHYLGLR